MEEIVQEETRAVTLRSDDLVPTMVSDVRGAKARLQELQSFVREVMQEGEDFGVIPGTTKPVLLKPGAEKLCEIYGLTQRVEVVTRIEDWERPFFHYEIRCDLVSKRSGLVVGSGLGSCNSREARYRWRDAQRICPHCEKPAIIKGREEYGGGWLCFAKRGGCGAKFADDDATITDQSLGRVENDDVYTLVNTLLKMAKKRAVVDATISVTRSSGIFTQDEEVIEAAAKARALAEPASRTAGSSKTATAKTATAKMITKGQQDLIRARMHKANVTEATLHEYLARDLGVEHLADLPFEAVNSVLAWCEQRGAAA